MSGEVPTLGAKAATPAAAPPAQQQPGEDIGTDDDTAKKGGDVAGGGVRSGSDSGSAPSRPLTRSRSRAFSGEATDAGGSDTAAPPPRKRQKTARPPAKKRSRRQRQKKTEAKRQARASITVPRQPSTSPCKTKNGSRRNELAEIIASGALDDGEVIEWKGAQATIHSDGKGLCRALPALHATSTHTRKRNLSARLLQFATRAALPIHLSPRGRRPSRNAMAARRHDEMVGAIRVRVRRCESAHGGAPFCANSRTQ